MDVCNKLDMEHANSQKDVLAFKRVFLSLASKFTELYKKSHYLLNDPRILVATVGLKFHRVYQLLLDQNIFIPYMLAAILKSIGMLE